MIWHQADGNSPDQSTVLPKFKLPAPGIEEDLSGFCTQLYKRTETLSILTITYVEIFNGTNESLLLTFVMFFNKFAI